MTATEPDAGASAPTATPAVEDEVAVDDADVDEAPTQRHVETVETGRWRGVSAVALLAGGIGVAARSPGLLLAAFVAVVYLAVARASAPPPADLTIERSLSDRDPDPGDVVTVRVRVRNDGDRTLPDLRIVDGVPGELVVDGGSPRHGTTLRPGATATFRYEVRARRGRHPFTAATAIVRGIAGARERVYELPTDDRLTCLPPVETEATVPLRQLTAGYTGRVETDVGGEGVEFHSTREYRPGDSPSRVDWNRYAATRELSTVTYREERTASVVLLLDLRRAAYVRPGERARHAPDLAVEAAGRLFGALLETGDRVGIAGLCLGDPWLAPGTGTDHRVRGQRLLATHPALSPAPPARDPAATVSVDRLRRRLPADAQVIFLSPMTDDDASEVARRLEAHGHLVTVVSPDATAGETTADRVGRLRRSLRLQDLRRGGIRVVDWGRDERLASAIERAARRWSP